MPSLYPPNKDELKGRREHVPLSEIKFYEIASTLGEEWCVWHSVRWDRDKEITSGEADFLIFNPSYGFIVIEVKGGIIFIKDGNFYSTNTRTGKVYAIDKDPFDQAEKSMHHILNFYLERAKVEPNSKELLKNNRFFPLNFAYAVFFPDCMFKQDFEYLQYSFDKIFDESDLIDQLQWQKKGTGGVSPLENFLITLLDHYKRFRVIKPQVRTFFPKLIGSNISRYINLKKFYDIREQELEEINKVQDFLINALSEKKRCLFKGSAGSGKTFIAMKKALQNLTKKKSTLFLCFNSELRESVRTHLSEQVGLPYEKIKGNIDVYSIHLFLRTLIKSMFDADTERKLLPALSKFSYDSIAEEIKNNRHRVPISLMYDALLVDEAQDIDPCLWDVLIYFLREPDKSLFYVFYDEEQALFSKNFSGSSFGMDESRDLIVLNKNLRNTVEIAKWLKLKTNYGNYQQFSGINGFKISAHKFPSAQQALLQIMNIVINKYYSQAIDPSKITVLSYYKLANLVQNINSDDLCDFFSLTSKRLNERIHLIEPKNIVDMAQIKARLNTEKCTLFKTISSFKGLENDVLFLLIPNLEKFEKYHPDKFENFFMQIYVGASRAKFKLYFFEYDI